MEIAKSRQKQLFRYTAGFTDKKLRNFCTAECCITQMALHWVWLCSTSSYMAVHSCWVPNTKEQRMDRWLNSMRCTLALTRVVGVCKRAVRSVKLMVAATQHSVERSCLVCLSCCEGLEYSTILFACQSATSMLS